MRYLKKTAGMVDSGDVREQFHAMLRSRIDTDAEFKILFTHAAKAMKKGDRSLMDKLLVQAPAAVTQAPNLVKTSAEKKQISKKQALLLGLGVTGAGAAGGAAAGYFHGRHQTNKKLADFGRATGIHIRGTGLGRAVGKHYAKKGALVGGALMGAGAAAQAYRMHKRGKIKKSSVDQFFEDHGNFMTEAQQRYPELLKVAAGVQTVPNLKPKSVGTTKITGPIPTQSSLSNGSA